MTKADEAVQQLVRFCEETGTHPLSLSRVQYREAMNARKEPVLGTQDIAWGECKRRAALQVDGDGEISAPSIPFGHAVKGASTMRRLPDGSIQWLKTERRAELEREALERLAEHLNANIKPRLITVPPPKTEVGLPDDILPIIAFGDPHIGMRAVAAEAGRDWNTTMAVEEHKRALMALVDRGPDARSCVVLNVGDASHADSHKRTTTKGTPVDTDGSHADAMTAIYETFVHCVDYALTKHELVTMGLKSELLPRSMSTDAISEWHEVFSQLADRDDVRGAMGFFKGFLSTAIIHGVDIGTPSISLGEDEGEVEFSWSRRHGFVIAFADSDDFHWLSDVAGVQQRGNSIPGLLSYVRQLLDG
tara:strand:+ start:644 stop:1729 length:1086 start_codon:yes stop_codon:yes gene_type:complete